MTRLAPGDSVGGWILTRKLGRGGTGTVYEATHPERAGRFAVKVLALADRGPTDGRALFERERHLLAAVEHPHVVRLLDSGTDGRASYLVMDLIEGETLRARLDRGRLPRALLIRTGRELLAALSAIHAAGILHRDLTPSNLMLKDERNKESPDRSPTPPLVVLDFGLARVVGDATVTASRGIRLSLAYAPPERFQGQPQDKQSDLYQAGLVLFEMATGRRPFPDDDPGRLATAHLLKPPPSAYALAPDLPPLLDRVFERALRKKPRERYASAEALREDWEFLLSAAPPA